MPAWTFPSTAALFGLVIGSFLNVCIHRIPLGLSVVRPASRCPQCGFALRWYHNIPLLSYFALRGRCAGCGARIPLRYPLVEALTGGLFFLCARHFGLSPDFFAYAAFLAALVTITFIDLDHQIIPDVISLPGSGVGVLFSIAGWTVPWLDSLLGVLLGGGLLWAVAWGFEKVTGREGMGGGDIKLLAMIGAFLGWKAVFPVVFLSSLVGLLIGGPLSLVSGKGGKLAIPFGPFLSIAAVIWLLVGKPLLNFYFSLFTP